MSTPRFIPPNGKPYFADAPPGAYVDEETVMTAEDFKILEAINNHRRYTEAIDRGSHPNCRCTILSIQEADELPYIVETRPPLASGG